MILGPVLLYGALTVLHTWPLATNPAHLIRDNADAPLNAWIVSWIAHQLPRDPAHLFDANIYYPERRVLAFSEPLLPPGALAIVPRALGASAVLTYNLLLMAGFFLTGLAGYVVGARLLGDRLAGLLAGSMVAFGPHTLPRLPHLQAQWLVTLPLSLLALDAVIRKRTWGSSLALGLCVALLAVTSGYGLALGVVAIAAGWLARTDEWWRHWRRLAPRLAVGALLSVFVALPVLLPYWHVVEDHGVALTTADLSSSAALPTSFISTPARLHFGLWSHLTDRPQGGSYFPGFVGVALAVLGLVLGRGWRDPRVRMFVAVALAGALVALGPATPLYGALRHVFPPMRGLRDPSRFGALVVLGVGFLAALGLAALGRRLPRGRYVAVALILLGIANAEVLCAPFDFTRHEGFSPIYGRLAAEPRRVAVAEFPFYSGEADYLNVSYVLASTTHWTPLVNGYSGVAPSGFERRAEILRHFPDPATIEELHRLGASHLIVHMDRYRLPVRRRRIIDFMEGRDDVVWVATAPGGERLYRLTSPSR
ncbi:MAG: hypothetical protein PVJ73_17970 [Acidobacteriota bacterium]